jgi:hypothetical protein
VKRGHYLWQGYRVSVGKGGLIAYGAPECHGLRATVRGVASLVPGDYARRSSGATTRIGYGTTIDFRGDQHSGGVETANAVALPRGTALGPSKPARFVVSLARRNRGAATRVRVKWGEVYLAGRTGRSKYGTALILRAGQSATVRCSAGGCTPAKK